MASLYSPLRGAIGAASAVICIALALYAAAAAVDDWPALVMAALGAALGAGVAINGLIARELTRSGEGHEGTGRGEGKGYAALVHQVFCVAIPAVIAAAGWTEDPRWLILAVALGPLWAWTLSKLLGAIDHADGANTNVYARSYQVATLALALGLIYGAVAADTPWLWRPTRWDHFQGLLWFVVLEFGSLPVTLWAERRKTENGRRN